jgi:hypothetical protein
MFFREKRICFKDPPERNHLKDLVDFAGSKLNRLRGGVEQLTATAKKELDELTKYVDKNLSSADGLYKNRLSKISDIDLSKFDPDQLRYYFCVTDCKMEDDISVKDYQKEMLSRMSDFLVWDEEEDMWQIKYPTPAAERKTGLGEYLELGISKVLLKRKNGEEFYGIRGTRADGRPCFFQCNEKGEKILGENDKPIYLKSYSDEHLSILEYGSITKDSLKSHLKNIKKWQTNSSQTANDFNGGADGRSLPRAVDRGEVGGAGRDHDDRYHEIQVSSVKPAESGEKLAAPIEVDSRILTMRPDSYAQSLINGMRPNEPFVKVPGANAVLRSSGAKAALYAMKIAKSRGYDLRLGSSHRSKQAQDKLYAKAFNKEKAKSPNAGPKAWEKEARLRVAKISQHTNGGALDVHLYKDGRMLNDRESRRLLGGIMSRAGFVYYKNSKDYHDDTHGHYEFGGSIGYASIMKRAGVINSDWQPYEMHEAEVSHAETLVEVDDHDHSHDERSVDYKLGESVEQVSLEGRKFYAKPSEQALKILSDANVQTMVNLDGVPLMESVARALMYANYLAQKHGFDGLKVVKGLIPESEADKTLRLDFEKWRKKNHNLIYTDPNEYFRRRDAYVRARSGYSFGSSVSVRLQRSGRDVSKEEVEMFRKIMSTAGFACPDNTFERQDLFEFEFAGRKIPSKFDANTNDYFDLLTQVVPGYKRTNFPGFYYNKKLPLLSEELSMSDFKPPKPESATAKSVERSPAKGLTLATEHPKYRNSGIVEVVSQMTGFEGKIYIKESAGNGGRPVVLAVPKGTNLSKPVKPLVHFHGKGSAEVSGNSTSRVAANRLGQAILGVSDSTLENRVLVYPISLNLGKKADYKWMAREGESLDGILDDVSSGLGANIGDVYVSGNSAGGCAMKNHLQATGGRSKYNIVSYTYEDGTYVEGDGNWGSQSIAALDPNVRSRIVALFAHDQYMTKIVKGKKVPFGAFLDSEEFRNTIASGQDPRLSMHTFKGGMRHRSMTATIMPHLHEPTSEIAKARTTDQALIKRLSDMGLSDKFANYKAPISKDGSLAYNRR